MLKFMSVPHFNTYQSQDGLAQKNLRSVIKSHVHVNRMKYLTLRRVQSIMEGLAILKILFIGKKFHLLISKEP